MRNILTAALAAGAMLDAGLALAAPPSAAPSATAGLSNANMFGWDTTNLLPRQIAVDQYGQIFCNNCGGGGGGGSNAAAGLTGAAVPTSGDYTAFSVAGTLTGVSAANPLPVTGTLTTSPSGTQAVSGTLSIGNFPATQAVSGTLAVSSVGGTVTTTPSVTGTQAVSGTLAVSSLAGTSAVTVSNSPTVSLAASSTVTLAAGASTIGTVALSSNTVTLAAGASSIGTIAAIAGTVASYLTAQASGGASTQSFINAATSTISGTLKASAGQVFDATVTNTGSTGIACLRIFASATVTVGSGTPFIRLCAGPQSTAALPGLDIGRVLANGITFDVTGGAVDTDTTTFTTAGTAMTTIDYK